MIYYLGQAAKEHENMKSWDVFLMGFCVFFFCRYGKVFKSHLFGSPTIVSTDAEVNRFVLQSDAKAFVTSYPKSVTDLMGKASILLINGPLHRRIHGLIGAFFKSAHLKAQLTIDMQKFLQKSMSTWSSSQHNPIHIQDEAKNVPLFSPDLYSVSLNFS